MLHVGSLWGVYRPPLPQERKIMEKKKFKLHGNWGTQGQRRVGCNCPFAGRRCCAAKPRDLARRTPPTCSAFWMLAPPSNTTPRGVEDLARGVIYVLGHDMLIAFMRAGGDFSFWEKDRLVKSTEC